MVLTGLEIIEQVKKGNIFIENFDETKVNPNSYNLKLHDKLLVYTESILDVKSNNKTKLIIFLKS